MLRTSFLFAKRKKGSNSLYTCNKNMVLAFCNYPNDRLSVYQIYFIHLQHFQRYAPDKLIIVKLRKDITLRLPVIEIRFLHSALSLIDFS